MSLTTNREFDTTQEKILSLFLYEGYQQTELKGRLVPVIGNIDENQDKQKCGIDLEYHGQKGVINIDEKAQLSYINEPLPTFAFELSSYQNSKRTGQIYDAIGWFLASKEKNKTDYYFLITKIYLKKNVTRKILEEKGFDSAHIDYYVANYQNEKERVAEWHRKKEKSRFKLNFNFKLTCKSEIENCVITKVKKDELIEYLSSVKINVSNPYDFVSSYSGKELEGNVCQRLNDDFRNYIKKGNKKHRFVLHTEEECYKMERTEKAKITIVYTASLSEKPINLVIQLDKLLSLDSTTQYKFSSTDNGSINVVQIHKKRVKNVITL